VPRSSDVNIGPQPLAESGKPGLRAVCMRYAQAEGPSS